MIYLDTSALAKLIVVEDESAALAGWLDERPDELLATSVLGRVELLRAARRRGPEAVARALGLLAVRSLDALHLASASSLGPELTALVAYGERLLAGARALGLVAVAPGS
ncbi:MAG: type II toxin-antitoxin system VapC family toxin [Nocardioides sp.]